jgi:hypothetical protein
MLAQPDESLVDSSCMKAAIDGWSEPAATNAPVEDEPVQPVLRMNILLAR